MQLPYLYKGTSKSISIPRSKRLKATLELKYETEITPVLIRLLLNRYRSIDSLRWECITEVDETDGKHIYPNVLAEFVLCTSGFVLDEEGKQTGYANVLLPDEEGLSPHLMCLTRGLELEFEVSKLELPVKYRKDGSVLRDKAPEDGGRVIHRLHDDTAQFQTRLHSICTL